jgi:drug/metabolite transporter (DMT)-like permease
MGSTVTAISQFVTTTRGVSVFEFACCRSCSNLIVALAIQRKFGLQLFSGVTNDMWIPLLLRCVLGTVGFLSVTFCFKHLPLSVGTVIIATTPFAVAILSSLFLNEQVIQSDIIAIFMSFTGILVMAMANRSGGPSDSSPAEYVLAIMVAVLSMLSVAVVAICARFMKSLHFSVIQTYNGFFGAITVGSILAFKSYQNSQKPYAYENISTYVWIILAGLLNSIGQNITIITMQRSNPTTISLYRYISVVYSFLFDLLVFRRSFGFLQIAGLSIVFCANIGAVLYKMQSD